MDASMFWALRKPLMWAWRKIISLLGRWTVAPIYRQAHEYHCALRQWQRRWVELANNVEYKLYTFSSFDEVENAEQSILIRNCGHSIIEEVHFCVEARLSTFSYQVPLTAFRLRPQCTVILNLAGLPLQDLMIRNENIVPTYESIQVYPVRIVRNRQTEIYSTGGRQCHPSHDDHLNGDWVRWEGKLLNIKAIADERGEVLIRLAHRLCWRHGLYWMDIGALLSQAIRRRKFARLPGVLAFAVLSTKPCLNAVLWIRLLLRLDRIKFEDDPAMKEASEYVLHKGESAGPVRVIPELT